MIVKYRLVGISSDLPCTFAYTKFIEFKAGLLVESTNMYVVSFIAAKIARDSVKTVVLYHSQIHR